MRRRRSGDGRWTSRQVWLPIYLAAIFSICSVSHFRVLRAGSFFFFKYRFSVLVFVSVIDCLWWCSMHSFFFRSVKIKKCFLPESGLFFLSCHYVQSIFAPWNCIISKHDRFESTGGWSGFIPRHLLPAPFTSLRGSVAECGSCFERWRLQRPGHLTEFNLRFKGAFWVKIPTCACNDSNWTD